MTVERMLVDLKNQVLDARAVPMSASCMMNRTETVEYLDACIQQLREELADAREIVEKVDQRRLQSRDEGDRIRLEAEEWAQQTANQTEIVRRAQTEADRLLTEARDEAQGLKLETDAYVDQRMAEFEASLQKTQSQVRIMRARLASRSDLDANDTQPLPRI